MSLNREIEEAEARLIQAQSLLPPEQAERSARWFLEQKKKEKKQKEEEAARQAKNQQLQETVTTITVGVLNAFSSTRQANVSRIEPPPTYYQLPSTVVQPVPQPPAPSPPPTSPTIEEMMASILQEEQQLNERIIRQSYDDSQQLRSQKQSQPDSNENSLTGSLLGLALVAICASWMAGSHMGVNPGTAIQNFFNHETVKE